MTMNHYKDVRTRFLREDERLIVSQEKELPLVIEADAHKDAVFLQNFLKENSKQLLADLAHYGAVLLRGFDINSDEQFENTVLSIPEFRGISEAFMAENGRDRVGNLKYVLHTNTVYKTGGTVYLGGFHTENYYSADVPAYICFYCREPSALGGETGLINTEKLFSSLNEALQQKLQEKSYFVGTWLVSEVAKRYQISREKVKEICQNFDLPIVGEGDHALILLYKPSVFEHPLTQKKALQLNLFELPTLNDKLRTHFMKDYPGKTWFWHRFFWKLPQHVFNMVEHLSVLVISFLNSPKKSYSIAKTKYKKKLACRINKHSLGSMEKVGTCFNEEEVESLAVSMRNYYSSCLWQKGDIILVDNRKVMHAGMPGVGPRIIRAMIANPIHMGYGSEQSGSIPAQDRSTDAIGSYFSECNS